MIAAARVRADSFIAARCCRQYRGAAVKRQRGPGGVFVARALCRPAAYLIVGRDDELIA